MTGYGTSLIYSKWLADAHFEKLETIPLSLEGRGLG
jgi:hypothetical protein